MDALIAEARRKYHKELLEKNVLTVDRNGIPSNADSSSKISVAIARGIATRLHVKPRDKVVGQTSGANFESINMNFLLSTFPKLQNLRPGKWEIVKLGNKNCIKTSSFSQYEHLDYLNELTDKNPKLAAILGNDYMVSPDVVIYRNPVSDEEINTPVVLVNEQVSTLASIRKTSGSLPILHASISAKWTMRSDRAQNSRTEALGLIRNRKGHLPHIVVVTGEPLPSRLASLALGTGDIDCMYHFALYELIEAVEEAHADDARDMLDILIKGKRIKDISDLPLDLAV
jgi:hypothetical protein